MPLTECSVKVIVDGLLVERLPLRYYADLAVNGMTRNTGYDWSHHHQSTTDHN